MNIYTCKTREPSQSSLYKNNNSRNNITDKKIDSNLFDSYIIFMELKKRGVNNNRPKIPYPHIRRTNPISDLILTNDLPKFASPKNI